MLKNLKLTRPLAVLDCETTGADPKTARIVELAFQIYSPEYEGAKNESIRLNPGIPIPPEATAIHGITDADVATFAGFAEMAPRIMFALSGCDLAGFNLIRYDLRVICAEFARCGREFHLAGRRIIDAMEIYHAHERRDLTAAVAFYCARDHAGAHGAGADVAATADVLDAQFGMYDDLPRSVDDLAAALQGDRLDIGGVFRRSPEGPRFAIGKYTGQLLEFVARNKSDYLRWILDTDFLDDAKAIVREAMKGQR